MSKKKLDADIHIHLPSLTLKALRDAAARNDRTVGAEIRRAIRFYLEQDMKGAARDVARDNG